MLSNWIMKNKKHESYLVNLGVKKLVNFIKINLMDSAAVSDITGCAS